MKVTAKEYLSACFRLNNEIKYKSGQLERLRAFSEKTSSFGSGGSGGGTSDRVGKSAARVVDLEKEIKRMKKIYNRKYITLNRKINALDDEREREVLRQRYLYFRSWRTIGQVLNMSHVLVQYYHEKALKNFSEKFLKTT